MTDSDIVATVDGCLNEAAEHEQGSGHSVTDVRSQRKLLLCWCDHCNWHRVAEQ